MDDGGDGDLVAGDLVYNPIAVRKDLPKVLVVELRNNAADKWKLGEVSRFCEDDANHRGSVGFGVFRDVACDGFDIVDGPRRPDYCMSHLPSFSSACCWVALPSVRAA